MVVLYPDCVPVCKTHWLVFFNHFANIIELSSTPIDRDPVEVDHITLA